MTDSKEGPVKVGELVGDFLSARGLDVQVERMGIAQRWAQVVGPAIAQVTDVRSVSEATLFVEVRSSAWMSELNMVKGPILERVNRGQREEARVEKLVLVLAEGS